MHGVMHDVHLNFIFLQENADSFGSFHPVLMNMSNKEVAAIFLVPSSENG